MYKYTVNQKNACVNGTSLKGYITTSYSKLVELFGEPNSGSADQKTTCEWILEFEDGTVGTIYDWKTSTTPKHSYNWNIGGHSYRILNLLEEITGIKASAYKF